MRESPTLGIDMHYLALPVVADGKVVAFVRAAASLDRANGRVVALRHFLWLFALGVCAVSTAVTYAIAARIVCPLKQLTEAAESNLARDEEYSISISNRDEVRDLATAFNQMRLHFATRIRETLEHNDRLATVLSSMDERGAIGFFGASYYFANDDKIRAVKIVDPETGVAVAPTPATIESGEYAPFSRPLFIYVKESSLRRPEIKKFIEFYLKNAASLAVKVDYVALPQEIYELVEAHYQDRLVGTHFLTADLEKRIGPLAELYTSESLVE